MKLIASPTERTTAATDVVLGLAAAAAVAYLDRLPEAGAARGRIWQAAFALIAAAAALGAAYHGLALPERRRRALWLGMTLALGTAISIFLAGVVHDLLGPQAAGWAAPLLAAGGGAVFAVSRRFPGLFRVFLIYEGLALTLALAVYAALWASAGLAGAGWMCAGALASLAAAAIQANKGCKIRVLKWEFDHNALFHIVQVPGIFFFCAGLERMAPR
jgi:hypothetical protein